MDHGTLFASEEKVPRTKIVEEMTGAGEGVFTVKFHKKIDDAHVKDLLSKVTAE